MGNRGRARRDRVALGRLPFQGEEHDASLAIARSGQEERWHFWTDRIEHCIRRIGRLGEHDRPHDAVTSASGTENLRVYVAPCGKHTVLAEFSRRLRGERCEGFRNAVERRHRLSEGSRTRHAVRVCVVVPVLVARLAAKFRGRAEKRHAADGTDNIVVGVAEVFRSVYAFGAEFRREAASDSPDLASRERGEYLSWIVGKHKHTFGAFLAGVVCDLGEGFRGREADAARDADPAEDLGADAPPVCGVVCGGGRGREDERLVDGILLHVHGLLAEDRDDAARHIAVQLVVGRAEAQLAGRLAVLELEVGRTHWDAERLELV